MLSQYPFHSERHLSISAGLDNNGKKMYAATFDIQDSHFFVIEGAFFATGHRSLKTFSEGDFPLFSEVQGGRPIYHYILVWRYDLGERKKRPEWTGSDYHR